jgi:hypothetical protein
LQLDSDDENEPANVPPRASGGAQVNDDSLEDDIDIDVEAADAPGHAGPDAPDRHRQGGAAVLSAEPSAARVTALNGIKMTQDYRAWIAARKAAWRAHRLGRAGRRAGGAGAGGDAPSDLGTLGAGMQRQAAAVMHTTWQIIQVCLT